MSVFSDRLKLVMTEKEITQAQLAKMTDIPKSAINQYLNDRFMPRRGRTEEICRVLGVDPAWLMGLTDHRNSHSDKGITVTLSHFEYGIILSMRENKKLFAKISDLVFNSDRECTVFRAAKSQMGNVPPSLEAAEAERITVLESAPETDDDL